MSLVYITHHNENVRDYEDMDVDQRPKQAKSKYVSRHKNFVKQQQQQLYIVDAPDGDMKLITDWGKHERRTMGCARTPLKPPKCFLRKNEGIKWRRLHDHVCPKVVGMAPVPRVSQLDPYKPCEPMKLNKKDKNSAKMDKMQQQQIQQQLQKAQEQQQQQDPRCKHKNFIAINRKRAIQAQTKRPPPKFVDTPFGNRQNLINSGLIPQFVCGKNFARLPAYINSHKKFLKKMQAACDKELLIEEQCQEFMNKHGITIMSIDERLALLEGLKQNYAETLKTFQTLSLYTDTPTKKLRKSRLEKELVQLESDIQFLIENSTIYIASY